MFSKLIPKYLLGPVSTIPLIYENRKLGNVTRTSEVAQFRWKHRFMGK